MNDLLASIPETEPSTALATIEAPKSFVEQSWNAAQIMIHNGNSCRDAFYEGARMIMKAVVDDIYNSKSVDEISETLLRLNKELHDFGAGR